MERNFAIWQLGIPNARKGDMVIEKTSRPIKYRHELKYEISFSDYYIIRSRLQAIAHIDAHAGADGKYHVRSLYFDNGNDDALRAKLNGLPYREKYRLRTYNANQEKVRLEKKSRRNSLTNKMSSFINRAQYENIMSGDLERLCESDNPMLLEFYAKAKSLGLKPKTIIDYWREAYVYPFGNVRVTMDSDIRSGLYATSLFDSELPTIGVSQQGTFLMEVKYDEFLPDVIRDIVQVKNRRSMAFSKYAAGRIYG